MCKNTSHMTVKISHDAGKPTSSIEWMITKPLPDYDLEVVEAPVPREVDPMLASQGFKDLLDEARTLLDRELAGSNLEIAQLTGAICHDKNVHRPGIWLVLREGGTGEDREMSMAARDRIAAIAKSLPKLLELS
jgi:hypothetical protein